MQNYKIVDYIRISGIDKWFDTGVKCKLALTIKAKVVSRLTTGTWGPILGSAIEADKPSYHRISVPNTSSERIIFDCGNENQRIKNNQITSPLGVALEIVAKNGELTVNGKTTTVTPFTTEFALDRNFMIGNNRNTSSQNTDCEYYYLQLFDGEDLVFDGIPCVDADGKPAFYDKVADKLIYAGGTSGTISNPKPHETFVYNVPKRTDGTFTCNVTPSHALDPKPYIQLGTSDSITIEDVPYFDANGAYTKVRCKYLITNTSGANHIGFDTSDIWRLFHYQTSYAYFDCGGGSGSYRHKLDVLKTNAIYDLTITNSSIYDNVAQSYLGQWSTASISLTRSNKLKIGSGIRVLEVDCYDGADSLIASLRPKQYDATQWGLYDSVNDKWYAVGKTKGETGVETNYWNSVTSADFGGAYLNFRTPNGESTQSQSITSITNVNLNKVNTFTGKGGSGNGLFSNYTNLENIGIVGDRPTFSLGWTFRGCSKLKNIQLNKTYEFDSDTYSYNTDYAGMFDGCSALEEIPSKFDYSKIRGSFNNGYGVFQNCGITSFTHNLDNLADGANAFANCKSLKSISTNFPLLASGYSSSVGGLGMFQGCSALEDFACLMPNLATASKMFQNCTSLKTFGSSVPNLTNGTYMFSGCTDLQTADLGNTTLLAGNTDMFNGLTKLENVTMSLNRVASWNNMFKGCTNLTNWNIKDLGIDTSTLLKPNVTSFDYIANNAKTVTNGEWFVMTDAQYANYPTAVATLQSKGWNVYTEDNYPKVRTSDYAVLMSDGSVTLSGKTYSNNLEGVQKWVALPNSVSAITSVGSSFSGKTYIYSVVLDLPNVTSAINMFNKCTALTSFSGALDNLKAGGNTYPQYATSGMFYNCSALTSFTTNNLNNLTNGRAMFGFTNITTFSYDLPNITNGERMFSKCKSLTTFASDMPSLTEGTNMFNNCTSLTTFASDMPSLVSGQSMFYGCTSLTTFESSMPNLVSGVSMFERCSSLTTFDCDLQSLKDGSLMFQDCRSLTSFTSDLRSVTDISNFFNYCSNLAHAEITVSSANSGWTQSSFLIPSSAPCQAYRYVDELGNGLVKLTFTSQERPQPEPTIKWDVVTEFGTPEYTIELNDSMLRPISDCLHLSSANQTRLDNYLARYTPHTDKAYIIYADNRLGSRGGSSVAGVTYRIIGENAGAYGTYGIILVHQDGTSAGYYDVYVNDTKVVSRAYGYGRLTVQGYTNNGRSLDLYNTNLEAEVTLPE